MDLDSRAGDKPRVSKEQIKAALRQAGIERGDVVFAHSSLSSFGHVEGGADAVIDALLETVGPEGTVAVPTFTWGAFHDKERVVFDLNRTPSECGRITEVLRKRAGAVRGRQVCHSVAAIGPRAEEVLGDGVSGFGLGSSLDRLYRLNSWYLFLGVGFSVCTALHLVEEIMQVPYRYYRNFAGSQVILPDGSAIPSQSVEFLPKPGYRSDFNKVEDILAKEGVLRTSRAGAARIINCRTKDIVDTVRRRMEEDIGFLLAPGARQRLQEEAAGPRR